MAKQDYGILKRTQAAQPPADNSDLSQGNIRALGIGLSEGERNALTAIAEEHGIARNALGRYALRWFILQYRAGAIDLTSVIREPPPPKKKIILPD